MLHLTFLGTSAGIPTKHRNVTALAVELLNPFSNKDVNAHNTPKRPWVLIDCGEATQHQLLHTNISSNQLLAICITHVHGDHCYGLPGLLASMAMLGRKQPLTIIAPQAIEPFIDAVQLTTELYLPYKIEFIPIERLFSLKPDVEANEETKVESKAGAKEETEVFKGSQFNSDPNVLSKSSEAPDTTSHHSSSISKSVLINVSTTHKLAIAVTKLSHRVPSYAFSLTQTVQTLKLDIDRLNAEGIAPSSAWGQLQAGQDVVLEDGKQLASIDYTQRLTKQLKIVVAGDNDTPELLTQAVQEADLLVHEATYTQPVADKIMSRPDAFDPMHTTAQQIASFAGSVNLPNLILTHFSARYQSYDDPDSKTPNMADIRREAEQYYQGGLWLARDFAQFEVSIDGVKSIEKH